MHDHWMSEDRPRPTYATPAGKYMEDDVENDKPFCKAPRLSDTQTLLIISRKHDVIGYGVCLPVVELVMLIVRNAGLQESEDVSFVFFILAAEGMVVILQYPPSASAIGCLTNIIQGRLAARIMVGRYTRDIQNPELLIPRRVTEDGSFLTFTLPNFYDRQELEARKKRAADANANTDADANTMDDDLADHRLHLVLPFNGADHHVELTPHHEFISPDMVVETRGEGALTDLNNGIRFKRVPDLQCHYRGHVKGHDNSRAALSLCEGVAGYVQTDQGRFFIEPLDEAVPDEEGQHIHMVYKRSAPHEGLHDIQREKRNCGTSDDWEKAWADQIEKKNRQQRLADNSTFLKRAPGSSATHSVHRFVELALFCDKRFLEFHKGKDYEQYLLTIMNMVSDFYHDGSVGNQMDVVVVRIVYLEKQKEEIDLYISPDAEKTLESFAAWQNKMNPKDSMHPNHHDVGVLVTRYDICSNDDGQKSCALMGLAYVAAACDPPKAACINEDSGLLLGIVITHEVGHTLGSGHDEPAVSGCEPKDKDNSYYVMSPIVGIFTLRWSPCSRKFITTYLESGLGECLNDNPKKPNEKYKFPGMLPGAMYDATFQCGLAFPESSLCDKGETICEALWCRKKDHPEMCNSRGPPAEGTKCAENKWCIHQKCVEMGKRPSAVHGGWGSWSGPGECSRTCGGGVRFSERECDNPRPKDGGRYCLGERKKYSSCNTAPCDEKKPSYRAVQCAEFDSQKVMSDGLHKWKPMAVENENPCILFCVNEKNTYVKLAPSVKDGTPCQAGTKNMCVGGTCRKVGCDWGIDSGALEDQCGICNGDGTQCTPVEGDYTVTGKSGYQKIVTVPKGSRNIKLSEKAPAANTLAIKLEKGDKYILNGNNREERNGEYPCAGDIAMYDHPQPEKEEVLIKGPIEEDIQLQYVFYKPNINPGVHYVYYVRSSKALGSNPQYLWDFLDWGACSVKCGGGTQLAQASCVEHQTGRVSNTFCKDIPRPDPKSRVCDSEPCGAKWRVSEWSACSGCGGKQGQQRRKVQCVKPAARPGGEDVQAELGACKGQVPKQAQDCTGSKPCKKNCSKKTRSNDFDERSDACGNKRLSLEEQRSIIDKLVDTGMTRYLDKPNIEHTEVRSKKRNVAADFKHLITDWVAPSDDVGLDGKRNCPEAEGMNVSTPKPGTVIKDVIPPSSIVVMEAPYIDGIVQSNLSDQAFQEDGDLIGVELETNKMKNYTGEDAAQRLQDNEHQSNEPLPNRTAETKGFNDDKMYEE